MFALPPRSLVSAMLLLLLLGGALAPAQERESVFSSANEDFAAGNYDQAALKYESLVEKGLFSPDVFYNLGTTLFRLDRPGEAMLAFRRAQLLDPTLPEARQNIEVLRNQQGFLEFSDNAVDRFIRLLPRGLGRSLGATFLWLALISIVAGFALPRFRSRRSGWVALGIGFALFSLVFFRLEHHRATRLAPESFSIVVGRNVKALTAPTPGARPVIDLPGGSEVRVVQDSGPWRYVDIPGSLRGWVRAEQVEPVWPVATVE